MFVCFLLFSFLCFFPSSSFLFFLFHHRTSLHFSRTLSTFCPPLFFSIHSRFSILGVSARANQVTYLPKLLYLSFSFSNLFIYLRSFSLKMLLTRPHFSRNLHPPLPLNTTALTFFSVIFFLSIALSFLFLPLFFYSVLTHTHTACLCDNSGTPNNKQKNRTNIFQTY